MPLPPMQSVLSLMPSPISCGRALPKAGTVVFDQPGARCGQRLSPSAPRRSGAGGSRPIAVDTMRDLPLSKRPERTILPPKPPEARNIG